MHVQARQDVPEAWLTVHVVPGGRGPARGAHAEQANEHSEFVSTLLAIVGDPWREADPTAGRWGTQTRLRRCGACRSDSIFLSDLSVSELRPLHEFVATSAAVVESISVDADAVATAFGLRPPA